MKINQTSLFTRRAKGVIIGLEVVNMNKFISKDPKVCKLCGNTYQPTSNRQKYCTECQKKKNAQCCKDRYQRTYIKKGYNQKRENNNAWTTGIGSYKWAVEKTECSWCGSKENLLVHHKDLNRNNNDLSNLIVICKSCHQKYHVLRDPITGKFTSHL